MPYAMRLPRGERRRSRRLGRAVSIFALAVFALSGCSNDDPRALPGTDADESLDQVLAAFQLKLPSCPVQHLGWSGHAKGLDMKVELRFRASKDCVHGYLVSQHVDFDQAIDWPFGPVKVNGEKLSPTRPPLQEEEMKRLNLHLDPEVKCPVYEFRTPSGALLKVLVDPRGEEESVYLVSRSTGE